MYPVWCTPLLLVPVLLVILELTLRVTVTNLCMYDQLWVWLCNFSSEPNKHIFQDGFTYLNTCKTKLHMCFERSKHQKNNSWKKWSWWKNLFWLFFFSFKRSFLMSIWTITTQLLLVNPIFFCLFRIHHLCCEWSYKTKSING